MESARRAMSRPSESEASRQFTGALGSLLAAFISCLAGLVPGSLILCRYTPHEFYWILCAPVVAMVLMVQFVLATDPVPAERARNLFMEAWPNLLGSVGAFAACYLLSKLWFT